jgi:hypothetical protein
MKPGMASITRCVVVAMASDVDLEAMKCEMKWWAARTPQQNTPKAARSKGPRKRKVLDVLLEEADPVCCRQVRRPNLNCSHP